MCGILGIVALNGRLNVDERRFDSALQTMRHRGPNAQVFESIDDQAVFGHTRLSIIDLSDASNQPMQVRDRYWLVYNGEIFNYLELREMLEAEGASFKTNGDAEVLLNAYIHWGEDCVLRFNGMWGFAIYDRQERSLFCSRDRFGEKPFNYALIGDQFLFASEIKAILRLEPSLAVPNYNVIANFCRTSVGAQHPETWFKLVKRLQPGHNLLIQKNQISVKRYWNYPAQVRGELTFAEACDEYRHLFRDAVNVRMRSDVPLGITLSAGIDSNSIAYAMQASDPSPHHCFTARFHSSEGLATDGGIYVNAGQAIDESVSAKRVASELQLTSHVIDTDYSQFVGRLSAIVWHLESGNSSPAVIPLMQLLKAARDHVTVLLEGQGADELLGGYVANIIWQSCADLIAAGRIAEASEALREYSRTYTVSHSVLMALRGASNRVTFLSDVHQKAIGAAAIYGPLLQEHVRMRDFPELIDIKHGSWVAAVLRRQHSGGLVNLLHYGDAVSMANSIETRMPFLDHRLVEFTWGLPADFKVNRGLGKHLHREAMRGLVPEWILDNRTKFGFNSPISQQFRKHHNGAEDPTEILLGNRCTQRGLFNRDKLKKLIEVHRSGKRDHGPLLFRLLSTELWFRHFIDQPAA